ncbi:ATP-binding protein [cf. Phormidesmis sp. LEGE 11477]|uniref:hybrid sensor histidine kinase/response regulator n=1 Tax=cf. Phormidesmis sp. LEGE 11477 TaxID=1828680 RepID=UPI00187F0F4A|nr:ATP-binding protein [cf. Phormidesmis sp. LEGE 11477]MBE9061171.1 hybrid sensor histidine kinase/response regulator [cf. Phormidesmis sp. LEGE 11477]
MQVSINLVSATKQNTFFAAEADASTVRNHLAVDSPPIKILLVDDQPMVAECLEALLVDEKDMQLVYCRQANQALAVAIDIRPAVILQDLTMPETDGLVMVEAFRTEPKTCSIPVIVLSSQEDSGIKAAAFSKGASDYLVKIPEPIEFVARLRCHASAYANLLKIKRTEKRLAKQNEILEYRVAERTAELEDALSNLKQAQAQLIQEEKMASLGQLVAGVAHEINNPINFVYGNLGPAQNYVERLLDLIALYQSEYPVPTDVIQDELDEFDLGFITEDFKRLIGSLRLGTQRIKDIVVSLRNFARLDESEKKFADIREGLDSTLLILSSQMKEIKVVKTYDDLPLVECLPGQLNQVFMNILANAIAALKSVEHPQISIQTAMLTPNVITIEIADNGPGMPPEVQGRIFDPFYTTKPVGEGTGLGLSISHDIIVQKHQGKLHCHSTPGKGTTFLIDIPISTESMPSKSTCKSTSSKEHSS